MSQAAGQKSKPPTKRALKIVKKTIRRGQKPSREADCWWYTPLQGEARKASFKKVREHVEAVMGDTVAKEELREGFRYAERRQCIRQGVRRLKGEVGDRVDAEEKFKEQATNGYVRALTGEECFDSEDEELKKHLGVPSPPTQPVHGHEI